MKNLLAGLIIGALVGCLSTYGLMIYTDSKIDGMSEEEIEQSVMKNGLKGKISWAGFQMIYSETMNDGRPLEEQNLGILRDLDLKMWNQSPGPTKPTVINYWSSGCAPCIKEIPLLIELKNRNKGKANFYAATPKWENKKHLISFVEKIKYNWIQVKDEMFVKNTKGGSPVTIVYSQMTGKALFKKTGLLTSEDIEEIQDIIDNNQ